MDSALGKMTVTATSALDAEDTTVLSNKVFKAGPEKWVYQQRHETSTFQYFNLKHWQWVISVAALLIGPKSQKDWQVFTLLQIISNFHHSEDLPVNPSKYNFYELIAQSSLFAKDKFSKAFEQAGRQAGRKEEK